MATTPRPNPYESAGRARKLERVIHLVDQDARSKGFDPHRDAAHVASVLRAATDAHWADIEIKAKVNVLSVDSRAAVIAVYDERAALQPRRCPMGHVNCYREACGEEAGIRDAQRRAS